MTTKFNKLIATACLVSLLTASIVFAEGERGRGRPDRGAPRGRMALGGPGGRGMGPGGAGRLIPPGAMKELELTEDQGKEIDALQKGQKEKLEELSKSHQDLRKKLQEAIEKGDKSGVTETAKKIGTNIGNTALLRLEANEKIKEILNDEQEVKLAEYNKKRAEKREMIRKRMEKRRNKAGEADKGRRRGRGRGRGGKE